jgi:H+/Cl- antiporter ClcA
MEKRKEKTSKKNKETSIGRRIFGILLCIIAFTITNVVYVMGILIFCIVYQLYYLIRDVLRYRHKIEHYRLSKELKDEVYMMIFTWIIILIPLILIVSGFAVHTDITHHFNHSGISKIVRVSHINGWLGYCIIGCFLFGLFWMFTVCKHVLKFNKEEIIKFQSYIEGKVKSWVSKKL